MFEKLTLEQPARKDYAQAFVEACLIADSITEKQKGLLRSRVAAFPDEVQANIDLFASALSKHQLFDQLRPLLEQILELEPTRVDVRLQLVDVLNSRGKHVEAEAHLQTLLALTSGNENLPSGRLVSTPPVSEPTW